MSGLAVILFTECFPECNACQLKNVYLCQKIQKNEFAETDSYHKQTQRLGLKPAGGLFMYLSVNFSSHQ